MATAVDIGTLIVRTPGTMAGRPRIDGTRITVGTIAMLVARGVTPEQIVSSYYRHLSFAQVYAALAYYHVNRAEIDADLAQADREAIDAAEASNTNDEAAP